MRFVALLAGMLLAACTQAPDPATRKERPTIVSLNPCSDAVLARVTEPGQLLAISHYSQDPESSSMEIATARRFPAVSGTVEEVLALDPDVVVAGSYLPPATRAAFDRLGIEVVTMPIAKSVEESEAQVMQLARLAGNEPAGWLLYSDIEAALMRAAVPKSAIRRTAIVWQAGGIVPGEDTLVSDLLRRSGYYSQSAARGMRQADYLPLETLLADPPEVIFAAGDPRANENRLLSHPALSALEGTRVARFDPSLLWCGGPTIVEAAQRLATVRSGR